MSDEEITISHSKVCRAKNNNWQLYPTPLIASLGFLICMRSADADIPGVPTSVSQTLPDTPGISPLNLACDPLRHVLLLAPFYRGGNWGAPGSWGSLLGLDTIAGQCWAYRPQRQSDSKSWSSNHDYCCLLRIVHMCVSIKLYIIDTNTQFGSLT